MSPETAAYIICTVIVITTGLLVLAVTAAVRSFSGNDKEEEEDV